MGARPPDFEHHPHGGQRLNGVAVARYLEQWERELLTNNSGDPSHLLDSLQAQVLSLKAWIKGAGEVGIYHAGMRRLTPSEPPQKSQTPSPVGTGVICETKPPGKREIPGSREIHSRALDIQGPGDDLHRSGDGVRPRCDNASAPCRIYPEGAVMGVRPRCDL